MQEFLSTTKLCPDTRFWFLVGVVEDFLEPVDNTFKKLQGRDVTLEDQARVLEELQDEIADVIGACRVVEGVGSQEPVDGENVKRDGRWLTYRENCEELVCNLSLWSKEAFESLDEHEEDEVLSLILDLHGGILKGIDLIFTQRESNHGPDLEGVPPFMPKKLLLTSPQKFNEMIEDQKPRLVKSMTEDEINSIASEFKQLIKLKHRDTDLLNAIMDLEEKGAGFNAVWKPIRGLYPNLFNFSGGFATCFASTATVESDFSLIKYEKTDQRQRLTSLSLQGILQCKQFNKLRDLGLLG